MPAKAKPKTIAGYINAAPAEARGKLREMLECLRKAAPDAEEGLKWGMPALSYDRILFTFAAFKHHISLYPTPAVVKAFAKELSKFKISAGTIQFPWTNPCLCRSSARLQPCVCVKWWRKTRSGCETPLTHL